LALGAFNALSLFSNGKTRVRKKDTVNIMFLTELFALGQDAFSLKEAKPRNATAGLLG
jgi:hypothetical protein